MQYFSFEHTILNLGDYLYFTHVDYTSQVCPYVFMRSPFKSIHFNQISNSLIFKNQLEFLPINEPDDLYLPNFRDVTLCVAYERITFRLFNKNVFKKVVKLHLEGFFYGIQVDVFEGLNQIKEIHLQIDSIEVLLNILLSTL